MQLTGGVKGLQELTERGMHAGKDNGDG
jgi:hypothetical protein